MMKRNPIALIAAMNKNRIIGRDGQLPWRLPRDMQWFRQHTLGKPVIMGRKTCESLLKALPERRNITVSRQADFSCAGFEIAATIEAAIAIASQDYDGEIMIIGGETLYQQTLSLADTIYLTEVEDTSAGDAFFPKFNTQLWHTALTEVHPAEANNRFALRFSVLQKTVN